MIDDVWTVPEEWSGPAPTRRSPVVIAACVFAAIVVVLVLIAAVFVLYSHGQARPDANVAQGRHVPVEEGAAPDGRHYSFEVSRSRSGELCSFLQVQTNAGSGGGGMCASREPVTFGSSSTGGVWGTTVFRVAAVEVTTPNGVVSIPTKALPGGFAERRYFAAVLPAGTKVVSASARTADGFVVWRHAEYR